MADPLTPMMQQYQRLRGSVPPDVLLLFRLGDFYEMFYDDAAIGARELDIVLTSRPQGKGRERVPLCGVPHHRLESYLARLVEKGYKVAICEQIEESQKGRKILKRDVVRVVTPGTLFEAGGKEQTLAALFPEQDHLGVAFLALLGFGWWALLEWRTPGFVWYTVVDNHLLNVLGARQLPDEDVPLAAGEFLAVALLGAAPWVLAAGAALWALVRRRGFKEAREFPWTALALWIGVIFGGTMLSSFRLPHYGLPAYFAIALLAARGWEEHGGRGLAAAHALLFAALGLACAMLATTDGARVMESVLGAADVAARKSAAVGQAAPLPSISAFHPLLVATAVAFAAGALALGAWAAALTRLGRRGRLAAPFIVVATMLLVLPSVAGALSLVASHRAVRGVGLELARRVGPDDLVAHEGPLENSGALEWYSGRRPVIVDGRRSVLAFGALRPEARDQFWEGARLRDAWLGGRRVWVVSVRSPERSLVAGLPGARLVAVTGGRWLYVNEPRGGESGAER